MKKFAPPGRRIPAPIPSARAGLPHRSRQPGGIRHSLVPQVLRQRIRSEIKRIESLFALREELANAVYPIVPHIRCDIGENNQTQAVRMARATHQRRLSAARRTDKGYRAGELLEELFNIASEGVQQVIAVFRPVAVTMPAQIKGDAVVTLARHGLRRAAPGVAALAAAMEKEHGRGCRIAIGFPGQRQPVSPEFPQFAVQVRL